MYIIEYRFRNISIIYHNLFKLKLLTIFKNDLLKYKIIIYEYEKLQNNLSTTKCMF